MAEYPVALPDNENEDEMTELLSIADKLDQLSGSELKAIIAIYTEGKYLGSREMMNITGMARKTCLRVMESDHVKEAVDIVSNTTKSDRKKEINQIRRMLNKIEADAE